MFDPSAIVSAVTSIVASKTTSPYTTGDDKVFGIKTAHIRELRYQLERLDMTIEELLTMLNGTDR